MSELNLERSITPDDAQKPEGIKDNFLTSVKSAKRLLCDQHDAHTIEEEMYESSLGVLAQLESAQEGDRAFILKKAYGSGDIPQDLYRVLSEQKDAEEFPLPEDVYKRTKEVPIEGLPPDFFKDTAREAVDAFTESPDELRAVLEGGGTVPESLREKGATIDEKITDSPVILQPTRQQENVKPHAVQRFEKPLSSKERFDELTTPYKDKGMKISVTNESMVGAAVYAFPGIAAIFEKIGIEKLRNFKINFFVPKYGQSAHMFVGNLTGKGGKKLNINVNSSPADIEKFIRENIA